MCRGDHRFPERPRLNHNKTESRCNLVLIAAAFITAYSIHNGNVEKMSDRLNPLFGIGCILSAQNLVVLVDSARSDLLRGYHLRSHPYDKRSGSELQIRSRAVTMKFRRISLPFFQILFRDNFYIIFVLQSGIFAIYQILRSGSAPDTKEKTRLWYECVNRDSTRHTNRV